MRQVTATIPIVTTVARDPAGVGLAASLAPPGGNVTGLAFDAGPELGAKVLQLLTEAVPRTTLLAVLRDHPAQPALASYFAAMEAASGSLGIALHWVDVGGPSDVVRSLAATLRDRPGGLVVAGNVLSITHARARWVAHARSSSRHRRSSLPRARRIAEFLLGLLLVRYFPPAPGRALPGWGCWLRPTDSATMTAPWSAPSSYRGGPADAGADVAAQHCPEPERPDLFAGPSAADGAAAPSRASRELWLLRLGPTDYTRKGANSALDGHHQGPNIWRSHRSQRV